jgi:hypothetical protein
MNRPLQLSIALLVSLSLAGCLVPEKFSASATIKADASYTYIFEGTAVNIFAAESIKKKGALSSKEETQLKQDADKASSAKGVRKFSYLGAGRYNVSLEREMLPGQRQETLGLITVKKDKDGVVTVNSSELKENDLSKLQQIGVKPDGTIAVYLPPNAKVIAHNATGTPGVFEKAYTWKVGSFDQRPTIKFSITP